MMKAATLISCITIALSVSIVKDVYGGKTVSNTKLENWTAKNKNAGGPKMDAVNQDEIKKAVKTTGQTDEMSDLLEVIQYIIIEALNNSEYRSFMVKRYLHNYIPQVSKYFGKIKNLKKKMDPEAAKADDKKDKAMKNHK